MNSIYLKPINETCVCGKKQKTNCDFRDCNIDIKEVDCYIIDMSEVSCINSVFISRLLTLAINNDLVVFLIKASNRVKTVCKMLNVDEILIFVDDEMEIENKYKELKKLK